MAKPMMNRRQYTATGRKLQVAYDALVAAIEHAEYFDAQRLARAADELASAAKALQQSTCRDCKNTGYLKGKARPADAEAHVAYGCRHANVPVIDLNAGTVAVAR